MASCSPVGEKKVSKRTRQISVSEGLDNGWGWVFGGPQLEEDAGSGLGCGNPSQSILLSCSDSYPGLGSSSIYLHQCLLSIY